MTENINIGLLEASQAKKKNLTGEDQWKGVYGAYQTGDPLRTEMQGIEVRTIDNEEVHCAVVFFGNIKGICPFPEFGTQAIAEMHAMVGQEIALRVISIDKAKSLIVMSRRAVLDEMRASTWAEIQADQTWPAVVRYVNKFQARLEVGGITANLPVSEMTHGWLPDARSMLSPGDVVDVKVVHVDREKKKIEISLRLALPDPWDTISNRIIRGGRYKGTITGMEEYGVFVELEPGVVALTPHVPKFELQNGQGVVVKINKVDLEKKHLGGKIVRYIPA